MRLQGQVPSSTLSSPPVPILRSNIARHSSKQPSNMTWSHTSQAVLSVPQMIFRFQPGNTSISTLQHKQRIGCIYMIHWDKEKQLLPSVEAPELYLCRASVHCGPLLGRPSSETTHVLNVPSGSVWIRHTVFEQVPELSHACGELWAGPAWLFVAFAFTIYQG